MATKIILNLTLAAFCFNLCLSIDPYKQPVYKHPAKPYSFAYGIKGDHYGPDFGQREESDGNTVLGSYTVQLPDGRRQTVTYEADHHKGFVAHVSYEGKAQYPSKVGPPFIVKPHQKPHHGGDLYH